MADTIDLDGEKFVSPSFVTSATSLDDIYTAWVADFQGSTTAYNPSWPSTDDSATLLPIPPLWTGGADRLVVSTECGVEIVPYQFTSASTHYSQAIAGVSRYYSINCGLRLAIIFHPTGVDSGITSFSGNYNADLALFRGTHNRSSENVQFVARVVPGRQIDVAIKNTAQTAGLPIKLVVLNGTTVVSSTDLTKGKRKNARQIGRILFAARRPSLRAVLPIVSCRPMLCVCCSVRGKAGSTIVRVLISCKRAGDKPGEVSSSFCTLPRLP
ncbi:hypothetical protein M770_30565 (plasmid) [Pseudomonas aeruginosa VRFPA03]|nr:hypothetical protein M770_30565 [Pseudomonas aeruginosa VRFPA03]